MLMEIGENNARPFNHLHDSRINDWFYYWTSKYKEIKMPYVDNNSRDKYKEVDKVISQLSEITSKGDLEYLVFRLMVKFMATREKRYSTLHDVVYAVAHCADEYRRRFLDVRENEALESNGDIKETIYLNEENED